MRVERLIACILCFSFLVMVTACESAQQQRQCDLSDFKNDSGAYEFADTPWDEAPGSTSKRLGIKLGEPVESKNIKHYKTDAAYTVGGHPAVLFIEFKDDQLTVVEFTFGADAPGGIDALFSEMKDALRGIYGEETDSFTGSQEYVEIFKSSLETEALWWDSSAGGRETSLFLEKMTGNSIAASVRFGVCIRT